MCGQRNCGGEDQPVRTGCDGRWRRQPWERERAADAQKFYPSMPDGKSSSASRSATTTGGHRNQRLRWSKKGIQMHGSGAGGRYAAVQSASRNQKFAHYGTGDDGAGDTGRRLRSAWRLLKRLARTRAICGTVSQILLATGEMGNRQHDDHWSAVRHCYPARMRAGRSPERSRTRRRSPGAFYMALLRWSKRNPDA